jgi:hypothetical protein
MLLIASLIIWTSISLDKILATSNIENGNETYLGYLSMEKKIISDLEAYIDNQESILHMMRKKLLTYKVEHAEAMENSEKYLANVVNKFLFIKRLTSDLNLMSRKTYDEANKFKSLIMHYEYQGMLPNVKDLRESSVMIVKMQSKHKLPTDKIVKGFFHSSAKQPPPQQQRR